MKNFLKTLLFVSSFIAPLITNAQPRALFGEPKQDNKYTPLTEKQRQEKRDWLINNSDYILQGGFESVGAFAYNSEMYILYKLYVSHVFRGENIIPENTFFVAKATGYIPADDEKIPFKVNSNSQRLDHPFRYERNGILFFKKNTIPITSLLDSSKMDIRDVGVLYPYDFYTNPFIHFDASCAQIYQFMDDGEWGFEFCGDLQCYGLYGKKISFQGMCHFLHQYSNIETPYGEEFINDYDPNDENQSQEIQDSTNLFENRSQLLKKNEDPIDSIKLEKFNTWLKRGQEFSLKQLQRTGDPDIVECTLYADYQRLEYINNTFYYKFDLSVRYESHDVDTVYPEEILFLFTYNSKALGTNIVTNGKFSCSLNSSFADTANYEVDFIDHATNANQVALMIACKYRDTGGFHFIGNRTAVPVSQKVKIANVSIEVPANIVYNNNEDKRKVQLSEVWNQLDFNVNRWSTDATSYSSWDTVAYMHYSLNDSYILGNPTITSVQCDTNEPIIGGCGQRLTIKGSGFMKHDNIINGQPREFSVVKFPNADGEKYENSNQLIYIPIDFDDIISWTDTCIVITIPSNVYGAEGIYNSSIGTGPIKIKNQVNRETQNNKDVVLSSSIYNTNKTDLETHTYVEKHIPYWARVNCSDQIQFELKGSIQEKYIKNLQKAFDEWNKVLGFTFYTFKYDSNGEIKHTNSNVVTADSVSVIYYGSVNNSSTEYAGVIGQTIYGRPYLDSCQGKYIRREIDLYINNANMNELTDQQQIYTFVHELGHGLGLAHVLDSNEVMYPQGARNFTTIGEGTRLGALKLLGMSDTITWTCPNIEGICSETTSCIPETPSITSVIAETNNSLIINWTPKNQVTSYTLKRSLNANMSPYQTVTLSANIRCFQDMDLTTNTTYYYQICANNANGSSAYSNIKSGTPNKNSIPNKNNSLNVQNNGTTSISINWSEEPSATEVEYYILERQEDSGQRTLSEYKIVAVLDANTHYYNDYDIEEGVNYSYRLRYITSGGVSQYSTPVSITPSELNEHVVVLPISRNALLYKNELESYSNEENTNYNNSDIIQTWRWTHSGMPTYKRSLFDIDLSQIPEDAIIESAQLELKGVDHMTNLTEHSSTYKSNASWLELVTEYWNEAQVTWNTQPASSSTYRVSLANSSSRTQNYSADITELVERMVVDTSVHGFMLRLQNETPYARMTFASPTYSVDSLRPYVVIRYITTPLKTLEIHPQKDAIVYQNDEPGHVGTEHSYFGDKETILAESWTFWGYQYYVRGLLGFDLSSIPSNAKVFDATLDLYSPYPQSDETYKHYSYLITNNQTYKSNASYLRCITEDWGENTTTWLNQPACDTLHQVLLPQSTSYSQDYLGIRIDSLIQRMIANPESTHGLMMELQNETNYARMVFASSDFPDPTLHPKLTVHYKVYPSSRLKSYNDKLSKTNDYKSYKYLDVKTEREFIDSLPIVNVSITPNPSHGQFYVNSDSPIQRISVYTNSLIIVKDIYVDEKDCKKKLVDLRKNKRGVYIIKIETQNGITTKEVILK